MQALRNGPLWVIIQDIFEKTESPEILKCRLCGKTEDCSKFASETICTHIKSLHADVVPHYTGRLKLMDSKYITPFFIVHVDQFRCKLCARYFKKGSDLKLMENHLRFNHKLNDSRIMAMATSQTLNRVGNKLRDSTSLTTGLKRGADMLDGPTKLENPSTSTPPKLIDTNGLSVISKYYRQVGEALECVFCKRQFVRKSDHILICHISMAHPLFKTKEVMNSRVGRELSNEDESSMEYDISEFFTKVNNRYQCVLCKLLFGSERHCHSHMRLQHADILSSLEMKPAKLSEPICDMTPEELRAERMKKLKLLNYSSNVLSNVTTVNYTISGNTITCDYFDRIGDTMQCIICDMMIKTNSVTHLLKHLRMSHAIFHVDPNKFKVTDMPPTKKGKFLTEILQGPSNSESLEGYNNPSSVQSSSNYVWNFFEMGTNNKISCMCCGLEFTKKSYPSLVKHLQLMHPSIYSEEHELEPLSITQKKQVSYPHRKGKPLKAERTLVHFLISQGVGYDAMEDPNFHRIQHSLNRSTSLSTQEFFDAVVDDLVDVTKPPPVSVFSFMSCTFNFVMEDDGALFAISMHHFENTTDRQDAIFLRKIITNMIDAKAIGELIQEIMKENGYPPVMLKSIVLPESRRSFLKDSPLKQYPCAYSQIDQFAEDIVDVLKSRGCIRALRDYVNEIRDNLSLRTRFELLQNAKGTSLDLTLAQCDNWKMTKDFLAECLEGPSFSMLSTFARRWKIKKWIQAEYIQQLFTVLSFLKKIDEFGKNLCAEKSTLSMVIPTIKDIETLIRNPENELFIDVFEPAFDHHLSRIIEKDDSSSMSMAMFFDSRYAYNPTIYDEAKWNLIENNLKEVLLKEIDSPITNRTNGETDENGGGFRNSKQIFELNKRIAREITLYKQLVTTEKSNNQCVFEWWNSHSDRFPILQKKSRETLAIPACSPDIYHYFGNRGKLSYLARTMNYRHLNNSLRVVARKELFRGAGCEMKQLLEDKADLLRDFLDSSMEMSDQGKAPPLPARIAGLACARQTQPSDKMPINPKNRKSKIITRKVDVDEDPLDFEDMLMLPPPPVLEQMIDLPTPAQKIAAEINQKSKLIREVKESEVKAEIEEDDSNFSMALMTEVKKEEPE